MSLPAGLSVAEVFAANPCDWRCFTKAKRGPKATWRCRACGWFSKTRACPCQAQPASDDVGGERV